MRSPWLRLLPALLVAVVAVWEIGATLRAGDDVPTDASWAAASDAVRTRYKPGDLIVFAPEWVDPVGRMHLGDLISLDMAARMDAARYATIWELSIRGAQSPDVAGLSTNDVAIAGGVRIRRFEQQPVVVLADANDSLATANTDGKRARGPTVTYAEVGFAPHRCVQVVPMPNQSVRITFPNWQLGRKLVGYVGLADVFKRRDVTEPASLEVLIGAAKTPSATVRMNNTSGWTRFEIETTPGSSDVTFVATALGAGARDRQVCFAAEARQ